MVSNLLLGGFIMVGYGIYKTLQEEKKSPPNDYYRATFDYCSKLTLSELQEYIDSNYILSKTENKHKIYSTCGSNDNFLIVKHIAQLAEELGRNFDNRFSRY